MANNYYESIAKRVPDKFFRHISEVNHTTLIPVIAIGDCEMWDQSLITSDPYGANQKASDWRTNAIWVSTAGFSWTDSFQVSSGGSWQKDYMEVLPLLTNIPTLKESVNLESRKYSINSVTLEFSNSLLTTEYAGSTISELLNDKFGSLYNVECRIFWKAPDSIIFYPAGTADTPPSESAYQVYFGYIKDFKISKNSISIELEDKSQDFLNVELPTEKVSDQAFDKYKNKPYPMVYGHVDRSPCVIENSIDLDDWGLGAGNLSVIADKDSSTTIEDYGFFVGFDNKSLRVPEKLIPVDPKMQNLSPGYFDSTGYGEGVDQWEKSASGGITLISLATDEENTNPVANNSIVVEEVATIDGDKVTFEPVRNKSVYWSNKHHTSLNKTVNYAYYAGIWDKEHNTFTSTVRTAPHSDFFGVPADFDDDWFNSSILDDGIESNFMGVNYDNGTNNDINTPDDWTRSEDGHDIIMGGLAIKTNPSSDQFLLGYFTADLGVYLARMQKYSSGGDYASNTGSMDIVLRIGASRSTSAGYKFREIRSFNLDGFDGHDWQSADDSDDDNVQWNNYTFAHQIQDGDGGGASEILCYLQSQDGEFLGQIEFKDFKVVTHTELKDLTKLDLFADVYGRKTGANDYNSIIKDLLQNQLGFPTDRRIINVQDTSFDWRYSFTIEDLITSKKLIEEFNSATPYISYVTSNGDFFTRDIPATPATAFAEIHEKDVIDFSFKRTDFNKIYSKIELHYNWNYITQEFDGLEEISVDSFNGDGEALGYNSNPWSHDYYKTTEKSTTLVIDDHRGKYIRSTQTAVDFSTFMLMYNCNQHLIMKVKLPVSFIYLNIGDLIKFNDLLGGLKPYGIDYTSASQSVNGQLIYNRFMITSINKKIDSIEVELTQLHNLSASIAVGCTDSNAATYNSDAVIDDGSCLYTDPCNNVVPYGEIHPDCGVDCTGLAGGTAVIDSCGVCGGLGASCSGCGDANALNYDVSASSFSWDACFFWRKLNTALNEPACPYTSGEYSCETGTYINNTFCLDPAYSHQCYSGSPSRSRGVWVVGGVGADSYASEDLIPLEDVKNYIDNGCYDDGSGSDCASYPPTLLYESDCQGDCIKPQWYIYKFIFRIKLPDGRVKSFIVENDYISDQYGQVPFFEIFGEDFLEDMVYGFDGWTTWDIVLQLRLTGDYYEGSHSRDVKVKWNAKHENITGNSANSPAWINPPQWSNSDCTPVEDENGNLVVDEELCGFVDYFTNLNNGQNTVYLTDQGWNGDPNYGGANFFQDYRNNAFVGDGVGGVLKVKFNFAVSPLEGNGLQELEQELWINYYPTDCYPPGFITYPTLFGEYTAGDMRHDSINTDDYYEFSDCMTAGTYPWSNFKWNDSDCYYHPRACAMDMNQSGGYPSYIDLLLLADLLNCISSPYELDYNTDRYDSCMEEIGLPRTNLEFWDV